jgi:hypothetical protein
MATSVIPILLRHSRLKFNKIQQELKGQALFFRVCAGLTALAPFWQDFAVTRWLK